MNSHITGIMLAGLAGLALGGAYFAALWWTVRRSARARHPAALLIGSYLVRAALLAGGILLVGIRDWRHLTACLIGLLLARVLACRRVNGAVEADMTPRQPSPRGAEGRPSPCD